jgi:uncharacterized protein YneF (UPF0154 family)
MIITYLLLISAGVTVFFAIRALKQELKKATETTPDDLLYDLDWKIECSLLDNHSELYFISIFKEYQQRPDINQDRLRILEVKFKQKFAELHYVDEYSPMLLDDSYDKHLAQQIARALSKKEEMN